MKTGNDPLIEGAIDEDIVLKNPNFVIAATKYGGHLGWYEKFCDASQFQNTPILMFCNALKSQ